MDVESVLQIVTLVAATIAVPKILRELSDLKFTCLRSNFAFTKDFVEATRNNPHPLMVEVGCRTIYPSSTLSSPEIFYPLSFHRPTRAFRLFNRDEDYLQFVDGGPDSEPRVGFGSAYRKKGYRTMLKVGYSLLYFFFALLAFLPIIFSEQLFLGSRHVATAVVVGMLVIFGWVAALSLNRYSAIFGAEKCIELQGGRL